MIAFIDDHREAYGVEPICRVLPIAPSTYHAHVARRADPTRLSARARRDDALMPEVRRVFDENFGVYGVRKVWRQLKREGHDVARCTVARLMQTVGLQGVIRGKPARTTISDKAAPCPMDHVNRQFKAAHPTALWFRKFSRRATCIPGRGGKGPQQGHHQPVRFTTCCSAHNDRRHARPPRQAKAVFQALSLIRSTAQLVEADPGLLDDRSPFSDLA
jgi:transposase InsO family protein